MAPLYSCKSCRPRAAMRASTSAVLSKVGSVLSDAIAMHHSVPYKGTYCRYGRTMGKAARSDAAMRAMVCGTWMGEPKCSDSTPPGFNARLQAW